MSLLKLFITFLTTTTTTTVFAFSKHVKKEVGIFYDLKCIDLKCSTEQQSCKSEVFTGAVENTENTDDDGTLVVREEYKNVDVHKWEPNPKEFIHLSKKSRLEQNERGTLSAV
jgi:hypothetical protein